jgi:hypothetical protein
MGGVKPALRAQDQINQETGLGRAFITIARPLPVSLARLPAPNEFQVLHLPEPQAKLS